MIHPKSIRKDILDKRANLPKENVAVASQTAADIFLESELYQQNHHIGFYIAHNGEIDPALILKTATTDQKCCYLPTLDPMTDNQLFFVRYKTGEPLVKNRYQIPEPLMTPCNVIGIKMLDLVLVPLVSFDENGNRLGMGKGYYDRTFSFKKENNRDKPILVGFAYEFQKSAGFIAKSWDVPMDYVVTEGGLYEFASRHP